MNMAIFAQTQNNIECPVTQISLRSKIELFQTEKKRKMTASGTKSERIRLM